jgi:hypothetical protein
MQAEWVAEVGTSGPGLSRLSVAPKRFDPSSRPLEITFHLAAAAEVRVVLVNERGETAVQLDLGEHPPGEVSATWDGRLTSGNPAASGVYHYLVQARGADGGVSVIGPDDAFVPDEVIPQRFELDRATGKVSYVLPKAARVRLRAGLATSLLAGTLLDWQPQSGGRHEVSWDGSDASGMMDLRPDPRLRMHLDAFRLPPNTVILETPGEPAGRGHASASASGYRHAMHDPDACRTLEFSVEWPSAKWDHERQIALLEGAETVRVRLDPETARHLAGDPFEVLFFVDTTFLFEAEQGSDPLDYTLDASRFPPGAHLLTVNVWSRDDHAGVVTVPFLRR